MRERLIELIKQKSCVYVPCDNECGGCKNTEMYDDSIDSLADHLLANGVIVPPMRLGQACFYPNRYLNKDDECRVSSITQKADGSFKIRLTNLCSRCVFEITADEIGKTVFLAREEAEKALKGGEGDG